MVRSVLLLSLFLVAEYSVAMNAEIRRTEYSLSDVQSFGIRCRRTLDILLDGCFVSKSFQRVHDLILKKSVDDARSCPAWKPLPIPSENHTRQQRQKICSIQAENRVIKNSSAFLGFSKETDCNLATANLSVVLSNGSVIGEKNLLSNGISPGNLKEDILYRVFSTGYFSPDSVDKKIVEDWLGLRLASSESYYDTELQICNKLFGRNGEFLDLIRMYLQIHKKSLDEVKAIVLNIYTENPPCGYCGPLLMHLVGGSQHEGLNIVRVLSTGEMKDSGSIKGKLQTMLATRKILFVIEVSSHFWEKYRIIYSSCDGITRRQYVENEEFDTLEPNHISSKNGIPYIIWHPFSLSDHFTEEKNISSIVNSGHTREAIKLRDNLRYMPTMDRVPGLELSELFSVDLPSSDNDE